MLSEISGRRFKANVYVFGIEWVGSSPPHRVYVGIAVLGGLEAASRAELPPLEISTASIEALFFSLPPPPVGGHGSRDYYCVPPFFLKHGYE